MDFNTLNIKQVTKETENAVSITFELPTHLQSDYAFKAGQYLTLKAKIEGKEVRRDYSLCTNPKSGELKVAVKEVENGTFSKYANRTLKIGDTLEVSTPNGRFTFEADDSKQRTIVAFAAGSGITPILSIAKSVLENEPKSKFVLVYGNKTPKNTIFFDELLALYSEYQERFHLQFVFSQSNEDNALFGRIETSTVNYILNKTENPELFYLCGPEAMIKGVSATLIEKGVSESAIKFELFTATLDAEEVSTIDVADGNTNVTVMVDDEEHTFVMPQTKTILESALEHKIDAPYSCQGGICSSCIARVTSGKAEMRQNNILTDGELEEGLILTCQAQPITPSIGVDYDDV